MPWPVLGIEAGIGAGAGGPQVSLMTHLLPIRGEHWALALGAGVSRGSYLNLFGYEGGTYHIEYRNVLWANGEVAAEGRWGGGFSTRIAAGYSALFKTSGGTCRSDYSCESVHGLPYVDVALGYSF